MPIFQIHHITKYDYDFPVRESYNQIRIFPIASEWQQTLNHQLTLNSDNANIIYHTDYFGNTVGTFSILEAHQSLVIDSRLTVRTQRRQFEHLTEGGGFVTTMQDWENIANAKTRDLHLLDFSKPEVVGSQSIIQAMLEEIKAKSVTPSEAVERSLGYIFKNFQYIKGITTVESTIDEILAHKSGVCQDFAHILLQILRTMGIPARYISGYICPNKNGMRGEGATHAWVEVWLPRVGWLGIDPTNNVWVTDTHVRLAIGRNFNDCTPMKGMFKGVSNQYLDVYVSIGYEDGHTFQEHHEVLQPNSNSRTAAAPNIKNFSLEQQQQQQ